MKFRLIAITLSVAAAFAQAPGRRPHAMSMTPKTTAVQAYLNLSDTQIASLEQLRQQEHTALKPIMEQMRTLHQSMRAGTGAADAATQMQNLEQQAAPIRASFQQQAQAVLTADQKTKLAALEAAMALMPTIHEAMGLNLLAPPKGMGPGGFGPEGMPHGRMAPPE